MIALLQALNKHAAQHKKANICHIRTMNRQTVGLPSDDLEILQMTAEAMEASEYQIFIEAYRVWYGTEPEYRKIDSLFGRYLKQSEVPNFVRHFARHYLMTHPDFVRTCQARHWAGQRARRIAYLLIVIMVLTALLFF